MGAALVAVLVLAGCSDDGDDVAATDQGASAIDTTPDDTAPDDTAGGSAAEDTGAAPGAPVASAGCGTSEVGAVEEEERTLDVDGVARRYLLTTPAAHDGEEPLPLVLDFHGLAEGAEIHAGMTQYSALAAEEGFVVVFPHGTGEPVRWDTRVDPANADLAYTGRLLDTLEADLCVDTSRVYATGLSNGAMMSSTVACVHSERIAAIAPIAGVMDPEGCELDRPVPVLAVHGTDDQILRFNGGVGGIPGLTADPAAPTTTAPPVDLDGEGYPAIVAAWAERNGCDPQPVDEPLEGTTDRIVHRSYDCPDGADTEFYIVEGGGHSWPGSEFSRSIGDTVGHTTFDLDATALGWEFFQQFALDPA
jgi:polyhydroxybutyrate depolymerase